MISKLYKLKKLQIFLNRDANASEFQENRIYSQC